jgi:hypothetical protein
LYKEVQRSQNRKGEAVIQEMSSDSMVTEFDLFLDDDETYPAVPERNNDIMILDKIAKCCQQPRALASNENFCIFRYLESKYSNDTTILETFLTVAAAPNNQSSVERAFSALRILLSHLRYSLSSKSINNLLICHLNSPLLQKIDFDKFSL